MDNPFPMRIGNYALIIGFRVLIAKIIGNVRYAKLGYTEDDDDNDNKILYDDSKHSIGTFVKQRQINYLSIRAPTSAIQTID